MRKTLVGLVALVALASPPAVAQESGGTSTTTAASEDWNRNVVLFNAGDLLNGLVTLEYEFGITHWLGLEFAMSVLAFQGVFTPPVSVQVVALAPEIGLRLHLIRNAPGGLWVGPSVNAAYITGTDPPQAWGIGFGAAVGYNFFLGPFALQVGVGGAVQDYGEGWVWSPRFRLGLGFDF